MIVSMMYECAVNQNIIEKGRKFAAVDCSEYANNPELLAISLFGNVKEAYTGADEDNPGLIPLANGRLLFLNEVHYLKTECQGKLSFFMDKGMYHKVGGNENQYYSECRLVFITAKDPQNVLLKTLLRRISIMVIVPALKDHPLIEKRGSIYTIFTKESKRPGKEILISNLAYQGLVDFELIGNIGALKNAIKAACANSFLVHQRGPKLKIQVINLSDYIFPSLTPVQLKSSTHDTQEAMIPIERLKDSLNQASPLLHLYNQLITQYEGYQTLTNAFPTYMEETEILI